MNELERRGAVQVPVQLVQNDPLHAKNLRCRKAAPALHNQVFNGAYYLCEETQHTHTQKKKGINIVLNEPLLSLSVYPHLIFLVDLGGEDEGGERDASQVFGLSLENTEGSRVQCEAAAHAPNRQGAACPQRDQDRRGVWSLESL